MTQKTLADYVKFLRKNKFAIEANFYSVEVVRLLKQIGVTAPLDMTTEEVMATLYGAYDILKSQEQREWDAEFRSE